MSRPGGGSGNGHRTVWASGSRLSGNLKVEFPWVKVLGAGLTDLEARAPEPGVACGGCRVTSGWAPDRIAFLYCFSCLETPSHSRETEFSVLGIAKLLPQIVPVKRETLQVVSLAMTGLVRG